MKKTDDVVVLQAGDSTIKFRMQDLVIKGYETAPEDMDANEDISNFTALFEKDNYYPLLTTIEGKTVHLQQAMCLPAKVNGNMRLYGVVVPLEYEMFGAEENQALIGYFDVDKGENLFYPEQDDDVREVLYDFYVEQASIEIERRQHALEEEMKKVKKKKGFSVWNELKNLTKTMFSGFGGGSYSLDGETFEVYDGGYTRTLTKLSGIYYKDGETVDRYVDDLGNYWYSPDGENVYKE